MLLANGGETGAAPHPEKKKDFAFHPLVTDNNANWITKQMVKRQSAKGKRRSRRGLTAS